MGTSGAYRGSGGSAWADARHELEDFVSGGDAAIEDVAAAAAAAIQWDDAEGDDEGTAPSAATPGADETAPRTTPPAPPTIAPRRRRGGDGGGGVGGRSAGGDGPGRGGGGATRTRRSRRAAALLGGGAAAAAYGLRAGDAGVLRRLGLDLAELTGLAPIDQASRIVAALAGAPATIEENELARASARMVIAILEADTTPSAADTVRIFAREYIYEVMVTELGAELRDGSRDGSSSVAVEQMLHDYIDARVDTLELPDGTVDAAELEDAIATVLEDTRRVMVARPA